MGGLLRSDAAWRLTHAQQRQCAAHAGLTLCIVNAESRRPSTGCSAGKHVGTWLSRHRVARRLRCRCAGSATWGLEGKPRRNPAVVRIITAIIGCRKGVSLTAALQPCHGTTFHTSAVAAGWCKQPAQTAESAAKGGGKGPLPKPWPMPGVQCACCRCGQSAPSRGASQPCVLAAPLVAPTGRKQAPWMNDVAAMALIGRVTRPHVARSQSSCRLSKPFSPRTAHFELPIASHLAQATCSPP